MKTTFTLFTAMAFFTVSGMSHAKDCAGKTVFSCKTKNNKIIQVCKKGNHYIYHYGRAGKKPELRLKRSSEQVIKTPWNGFGSHYHQSIGFKNGNVVYSVFSQYERKPDGKKSGGVLVKAKKDIYIDCRPKTIKDHIMDEVESN